MARPRVVELLEGLLAEARSGTLTDLFAVYRYGDGGYDACYDTGDLEDLLVQVGTEAIAARGALYRDRTDGANDETRH